MINLLDKKKSQQKNLGKLSKYNDLKMDIARMCHLNTTTIPVVVRMLKMIKNTNAHIKKIPGNSSI